MPYLVIDNFSAGLDSRRSALSSKDGTLAVLKNAHITRGGEIEKRKAFAQYAALPANTFGLETTADAVYVFGSVAAPTMPAGVTYQRLQHPDGLAMTKVVWSTVYGGLPFVIAEYSDGKRFCFWDGAIVRDWFVGIATSAMGSLANFAEHLKQDFSLAGYTCTRSGQILSVTGPEERSFTLTTAATGGVTATVARTQEATDGVAPTQATSSFVVSGGSAQPAKTADRTIGQVTGSNSAGNYDFPAYLLPGITSIRVGASSSSAGDGIDITQLSSGSTIRWDTIPSGEVEEGQRLIISINHFVNQASASTGYSMSYSLRTQSLLFGGGYIREATFSFIAKASLGADENGKLVQVEFDANPSGLSELDRFIDPNTIAVSPYNPARWIATLGAFQGGVTNAVTSVKVDGVEIMGGRVPWLTSNSSTMLAVVNAINAYVSSTEYVSSFSQNRVLLTAAAGTGAAVNGRTVSVSTAGNVTVSGVTSFSGGKDGVAGSAQISTITLGGTFTPGAKVSATIVDPMVADPYAFGASRVAGLLPGFSVTYKAKEYTGVGSTMYFSALNDATKWDVYDTGSGFIDMSNNFGGREDLTGFGVYQDKLAVFSRRNVQLWFLDADPAQNQQLQILANTGCIAPDSVVSMGAIDLLYLADNGIRSLRARDGTDTAFANDIGSAIDSLVIGHLATLTEAQQAAAKAVVEPIDGRYWLALGNKVYVLSYFPGANIAAWSTYELGFNVEEMAAKGNQVFARSGNTVYLYGGANGATYDSSEVVVEFPYMDARKPAHLKRAKAIDLTIEGLWRAEVGFDHTAPNAREVVLRADQSTFAFGKIPVDGIGTHIGLRMVNAAPGAAKISNVIFHYDDLQPKHEGG